MDHPTSFAVVPFAPGIGVSDLNVGLLFFLAIFLVQPEKFAIRDLDGYANIANTDPWGKNWNYSGSFADTNTPANQNEMGVCSTGPAQTPTDSFCVANFNQVYTGTTQPAVDGSVGYSSIYGSWQGKA